ncbi:MAG: hypothetical protein ACTSPV_17875 [Candidatus Hodarchaeales archaeon]
MHRKERSLIPPFIAVLDKCHVDYIGRAKARSDGKSFITIVKSDRTLLLHSAKKGMKPVFYNPSGELSITRNDDKLEIISVAKNGERLSVEGLIKFVCDLKDHEDDPDRIFEERIGTEKWMVQEIRSKPEILGLTRDDFEGTEVRVSSGRIDLLFDNLVVEVKKRAGARTYDQLSRYLRGSHIDRGIIVCLKATKTLKNIVAQSDNISIIEKSDWEQLDSELMKENY